VIENMEMIVFIFLLVLLLVHEMDAIRTKEWSMFIVLRVLDDELAYKVFTLAHIPLYLAVILILVLADTSAVLILMYVVDLFLVAHAVIHFCFRKKPTNGFTSVFSQVIIYSMGVLAILHMCFLFFG